MTPICSTAYLHDDEGRQRPVRQVFPARPPRRRRQAAPGRLEQSKL